MKSCSKTHSQVAWPKFLGTAVVFTNLLPWYPAPGSVWWVRVGMWSLTQPLHMACCISLIWEPELLWMFPSLSSKTSLLSRVVHWTLLIPVPYLWLNGFPIAPVWGWPLGVDRSSTQKGAVVWPELWLQLYLACNLEWLGVVSFWNSTNDVTVSPLCSVPGPPIAFPIVTCRKTSFHLLPDFSYPITIPHDILP